jgi:hypothetical protein
MLELPWAGDEVFLRAAEAVAEVFEPDPASHRADLA